MKIKRGKPYKKKIKPGDSFGIAVDSKWLCGRVVSVDAIALEFHKLIMVYVFKRFYEKIEVVNIKTPNNLLVPPLLTTRSPWSRGLFQAGASAAIKEGDVLSRHCFYHDMYDEYYNEDGDLVDKTIPCGELGIYGDIAIEELVHDAINK